MKIGFISGDLVEVSNTRAAVSVPDYPVQGRLMEKWVEAGHEVVLLTRFAATETAPAGVTVDVEGNPMDHDLDILFGDRLGKFGSEWDVTVNQLEQYHGPIVFHQYIIHSNWAPPFKLMPHLAGSSREWLILNRSSQPHKFYNASVGIREQVPNYGDVIRFERWEPFYMMEYPWQGDYVPSELVAEREYMQGYYGRLPQSEIRARTVKRWMTVGDWSKVIYGPDPTTQWVSQETGAVNGGRIMHRELPHALTTFNVTVQASIDRIRNKGRYDYWTHRIVECALAGVFQLFDVELDLVPFKQWRITRPSDLIRWMDAIKEPGVLQAQVAAQQEIILPRADPRKVHERLMTLLENHADTGNSRT